MGGRDFQLNPFILFSLEDQRTGFLARVLEMSFFIWTAALDSILYYQQLGSMIYTPNLVLHESQIQVVNRSLTTY